MDSETKDYKESRATTFQRRRGLLMTNFSRDDLCIISHIKGLLYHISVFEACEKIFSANKIEYPINILCKVRTPKAQIRL